MTLKLIGALVGASLLAVGCGPPSVEDVATAVRKTVTTATAQAGSSSSALERMPQLGALASGGSAFIGARHQDGALPPLRPLQALPQKLFPSDTAAAIAAKAVPNHEGSMVEQGERIAAFLEERIFTEDNVEERDGDAIIFRVEGEDVCSDGTAPADPSCVSAFDRFEVRLRATRPDNSIKVVLLLGPDRHAPYSLQMASEFVAMTVDLAEVRKTALYAASVMGQEVVGLPQVMEGVMEARAVKGAGEHDFTLSYSILRAVKVEYTDPNGGAWALNVAQRDDLAKLQFIEAEKRVLADLDVPVVSYAFPQTFWTYDEVSGAYESTTARAEYLLGGASFSFDTHEGATALLVSNIGLGDVTTTAALDGVRIVSVDLNRDAGRRFDLNVTRDAQGQAVFQVRSEFDLRIALNGAPLAAHGQQVAPWAMEDNLQARFAGGNGGPSYRQVPYDYETGAGGETMVLEGSLVLHTDEPGVPDVVVNPGQCLLRDYPYDENGNFDDRHPFLVQYAAGSCG